MLGWAVDIFITIGKLAKVELVAGLVTEIHGLAESALGSKAPEGSNVEKDGKRLDDNFNDSADESPVQLLADEVVVDVILEELLAFVVIASPGPEIFVLAVVLCVGDHAGNDSPEDDHEEEAKDGESGEPDGSLLSLLVTTFPVGDKDEDSHGKRNTSDSKGSIGWPEDGLWSPWWKVVPGW